MNALLRYLWLKSVREGWLTAMLIGPAFLILSPFVGFALLEAARGRGSWPMAVDSNTAAGMTGMVEVLFIVSAIAACAGAFNAFAQESASRSLGSILLAARPEVIVTVAVAFSFVSTVAGYAIARMLVELLSSAISGWSTAALWADTPRLIAMVVLLFACSASAGIAMVAITPLPTMLIPAMAIVMIDVFWFLKSFNAIAVAGALLQVAVLITLAVWFVRRRCAA